MLDYSALAPNVVLAAGRDDFKGGVATPLVPVEAKGDFQVGTIFINRHCIVGANSVVFPNVKFGESACVGALSLVNHDLDEWTVYCGQRARPVSRRNNQKILSLEKQYLGDRNARQG